MSIAIENFVKAIYNNNSHDASDTKPGNIAKKLGVSNAAATDMAKKLAVKGLLHYEKYQELQLTEEGKKMALNIVRKHRLWEVFLVEHLGYSWDDVHDDAEILEHATSEVLADRLNSFLGNPEFCPHGGIIYGNGEHDGHTSRLVLDMHVGEVNS